MTESSEQSKKRGCYARRDVHGVKGRKRARVADVGMAEMKDHCDKRLRESGAPTNYTEEMHVKAMVRDERAKRAARMTCETREGAE